ncbi:MAG: hypothetical protein KBI47_19665 [Armatimonadetes bacterium]|nr:hypothetical protein [Armatimonadota bacterium]MDI9583314.1 hypothetical protein [Acidobacteriota bacterium]
MFDPEPARELTLKSSATEDTDENRDAADRVAGEVAYLPLALEQAAAYVREAGITLDQDIELYHDPHAELLAESGEALGRAAETELLALIRVTNALKELGRYSLATLGLESVSVHRLVLAVQRDGMSEEEQHTWAELAIETVARAYPSPNYSNVADCETLTPHALVCLQRADALGIVSHAAALVPGLVGEFHAWRRQIAASEPLFVAAKDAFQRLADAEPDDLYWQRDLALSHNEIGDVRRARGPCGGGRPLPDLPRYLRATCRGGTNQRRLAAGPVGVLLQDGLVLPRKRCERGVLQVAPPLRKDPAWHECPWHAPGPADSAYTGATWAVAGPGATDMQAVRGSGPQIRGVIEAEEPRLPGRKQERTRDWRTIGWGAGVLPMDAKA